MLRDIDVIFVEKGSDIGKETLLQIPDINNIIFFDNKRYRVHDIEYRPDSEVAVHITLNYVNILGEDEPFQAG